MTKTTTLGPFSYLPEEKKRKIISLWKFMEEEDKEHFTNQVALALSVWGTDQEGLELVTIIIDKMLDDGCTNLADFGLYVEKLVKEGLLDLYPSKKKRVEKASIVLDMYRLKYDLPDEPRKGI